MQTNGLRGRVVRVTRRQPGLHRFCAGAANHLKGAGRPEGPDQQWAGDITYLPVQGKWKYLAVVLDLYSRKVISWTLGDRRTVDLTWRAMQAAIARRRPSAGLIFHTDRGIEYRSLLFRDLLDTHGIVPSMNRPGQTTDNATMESFFHTLKAEFFRGRWFNTTQDLRHGWLATSTISTTAKECTQESDIDHRTNMNKSQPETNWCLLLGGKIKVQRPLRALWTAAHVKRR